MLRIPFQALSAEWESIREESLREIDHILSSGKYIGHELIEELQNDIATKIGVENVLLVNSGTDALMLSLRAIGISKGDEVITVPNSFIATAAAINHIGGKTVYIDVGEDHLMDHTLIEAAITAKTKAILPVQLEGKVCEMSEIRKIAQKNNLLVIEDAAQAFGSKLGENFSGTFGDINCFSLHPLKNLNICGDGGFIASNDKELIRDIDSYRNHGQTKRNVSDKFGVVSRFDSLQAGMLKVKLKYIDQRIISRRKNAQIYFDSLNTDFINLPRFSTSVFHTYHLFVIEVDFREKLVNYLEKNGIETKIHYPNLIVDQKAADNSYSIRGSLRNANFQKKRILSLPIHEYLKEQDIVFIAEKINSFYRNGKHLEK